MNLRLQTENGLSFILALALVLTVAPSQGLSYSAEGKGQNGESISLDVPYVPTPQKVVDRMLELAKVKNGDIVYDLGSGDGRIVVTAAKRFGAHGVGVDMDPQRVKEARDNVKDNGVGKLVRIRQGDALKTDVSSADVVTLYLLPQVNLQLRPKLEKLPKGTRIVSHDFDMGDWKPAREETVLADGRQHKVYLWIVGQDKDGQAVSSSK